jgi:hypothetical protein
MSMHTYQLFGGALQSEISIGELPEARSPQVDWTLRVVEGAAEPPLGDLLGSDEVFGDMRVRAFRTADGFALYFDDTGRFDITQKGALITWHRPENVVLEAAQLDITSRVMALALHAGGVFTLHGSAVSTAGGGVAFLAPKLHGKSTLCSALVLAGARAITDDTVPIRNGSALRLSPGLPRLRLWNDSASRLFGVEREETNEKGKHVLNHLPDDKIETGDVPFVAAYVLSPVTELPGGAAVARERLDGVRATIELVKHAKLGPLLTGGESTVMLGCAADVARIVPVYSLQIVRDLGRIDEVAAQVLAWHPATPDASA